MPVGACRAADVGSLRRRRLLVLSACLLLPAGRARAAGSSTTAFERPFVIGTSMPGGGFALYGETVERVLDERAGRKTVVARRTNGTAENLLLLANGEVDAALIQGTAASEIFERPDADGLRVLFAMYPSPGLLAVPAASPVRRLDDVRGRSIVFGVRTSGLVTLGRQVFSGIGIDIDRDLHAIYVDQAAMSPSIVLAGDADGLWGAGEGWPGFERLARAPGGARFIGPTAAQIPSIVERYPSLKAMTVATGAYPGIDRPLRTVGSVNVILVRKDLDDARAAAFVDGMRDAAAELAAALAQASFSTLANTRTSVPSPTLLHRVVASMR